MMRVAIVGGGISGLVVAHHLHPHHDVTVFEAAGHVGGHAHTVRIALDGAEHDVDLGFVVFNDRTYPNFIRLLDRLAVPSQPSVMSFGVRCLRTGVEWCGTSLATVFAQPRNLLRPSFLRMLRDVVRFNRQAERWIADGVETPTLRELFAGGGYSPAFLDHYLLPMGSAIWSSTPERILDFPAGHFLRFFRNHGLLAVDGQFRWRTITGGSQRYVAALTRSFADRIRRETPVRRVRRVDGGVEIVAEGGPPERYDQVVIGAHADQALAMLDAPTPLEREILGAFPYQRNDTALHLDDDVLPRAKRARAAWNYIVPVRPADRVAVTYDMTRLHSLPVRRPVMVSLNLDTDLATKRVLRREVFEHPVFTPAGIAAQARHGEVSGRDRIHFCGAYWGNGFHEDGVVSALAVAAAFGMVPS